MSGTLAAMGREMVQDEADSAIGGSVGAGAMYHMGVEQPHLACGKLHANDPLHVDIADARLTGQGVVSVVGSESAHSSASQRTPPGFSTSIAAVSLAVCTAASRSDPVPTRMRSAMQCPSASICAVPNPRVVTADTPAALVLTQVSGKSDSR